MADLSHRRWRASIELAVVVGDSLIVHGRADELTQVLGNLLQNAVRYTPAGGRVQVAATQGPEGVTVQVSKLGPGDPPTTCPTCGSASIAWESRGTGAGGGRAWAAMVKQLVEDAGGRVGAASDAGWTMFWFRLPA